MRTGDHISLEDYDAMQPKRLIFTRKSVFPTWMKAIAIVGLFAALGLFVTGCDSEAAEITAKLEQDAYEKWMNVQAVARYRLTSEPIKASTLEVSFTVCHQYPEINRQWQCFGVKK